ncbi:MAG: biotin/lipoyl-containing protein [Endomicrobiia bacterium]
MKKETDKLIDDRIINKLKEVYSLMYEADVKEIDIKLEEHTLKIKRFSNVESDNKYFEKSQVIKEEQPKETKKDEELIKGEEILSPLNGIFYRSPSPGAPPFVKEGDIVAAGSILCIIEAMKVMNEIKADKNCRILKVLCENGAPVSAGTKLFIVEKV